MIFVEKKYALCYNLFWSISIIINGGLIMRAVITVVGKDMVGILAKVSTICAENDVNIIEVLNPFFRICSA
jgi:hypothetical protein